MKLSKKLWIYPVSLLGAAGTGLQNYTAVASFVEGLMSIGFAAKKAGLAIIHSIAALLGGLCSTLVNFCINIELLEDFYERLTNKPRPALKGWQKFRYYAGSAVFIVTGVLFGLTAIAFGPVGALAAIGIIAGIFVSAIMIIQELETWLASFDNPAIDQKKPLKQIFSEWKKSLTKGKVIGTIISIGNVIALSLLFTIGLASFFIGVGVPALPALIAGFSVAFTGGAFTEFYFYNRFLSNFCDQFKEKWQALQKTKYPAIGITCGAANALVNGALGYAGIIMISSLLAAASLAVPPFGVIIAIASITALFAGAASFILGMDFWIRNSTKLTNYFIKEKTTEKSDKSSSTQEALKKISTFKGSPSTQKKTEKPLNLDTKNNKKILSLHFVKPIAITQDMPAFDKPLEKTGSCPPSPINSSS